MDRTKASLSVVVLLALGLALSSGGRGCTIGVTPGQREVIVVRESAKDTPEVGRLIANLRDGPNADYLASKGHKFTLLDKDDKDADGKPVPALEAYKPFQERELLIVAPPDKLVHREPLPGSAELVIEALKKNGG